jgi:trypsin
MASSSYPLPTPNSYVAGWGTLSSGGSLPNLLNNVVLTIYSNSYCNSVSSTIKNTSSQICAGDLSGQKDTCQGVFEKI